MLYIKELSENSEMLKKDNIPKLLQFIIFSLKKFFCIFTIKNDICIIPYKKINKFVIIKLNRFIIKNNVKNIVLTDYLLKYKNLVNASCMDGTLLYNYVLINILEYISEKQNKSINTLKVTILINKVTKLKLDIIKLIATKVKTIEIVSSDIKKFEQLEQELYDKFGILIKISNNKKFSLKNSELILNMDFSSEQIDEYNINPNAIIISTKEKVSIKTKKFNGININFYEIEDNQIFDKYKSFDKRLVYESFVINLKSFDGIINKISQDNIKISALIGNNGKLPEREFVNKM